MTAHVRKLITRIARFQVREDAIIERWDAALAEDRAFDYGEFSGAGAYRMAQREADALARSLGFASAYAAHEAAALLNVGTRDHFLNTGVPNLPDMDVDAAIASRNPA